MRVYPNSADHGLIRGYYDVELVARAERRGLWSLGAYRPVPANEIKSWSYPRRRGLANGFVVARGSLAAVATRGRRTCFNFGADYRAHFTATWVGDPKTLPVIADGDDLVGRTVEARGFVSFINGPSIELRHPLQILAPLSV